MKLWKSLIVLIAVIFVGFFVYFKVYRAELTKKQYRAQEGKLVQFDLDTIKKFTLVRPDSSVTFERGVGRIWNITAPIKAEAYGKELYGLFESLSQSDILYDVDQKPKDLKPYGLDRPQYYMAMEYDDAKPDTLFIGNDTPTRDMSYMKFSSGRKVFAVNKFLTDMMKKPVKSYRSRTVLNVIADDVHGIEIFRGNDDSERIRMSYNGVVWMMEHPWELNGNEKSIDELLKKFSEAKKVTLVDEKPTDLAKYGLDQPSVVIDLQVSYGMPNKMLLIGNRLTEKGKKHLWYAKQFDADLVFTVEKSFVNLVNRPLEWFVDSNPLRFNRNIVNKILLQTDKQTVVFTMNTEGKWSVISPVDRNVPNDTINNIFSISRFVLLNKIFSAKPTPKELADSGLDRPKYVLTFYAGDQELAKIAFGKTFTGDKLMTYAQTSLSPIIFITSSQVNSSINYVLETVFGK